MHEDPHAVLTMFPWIEANQGLLSVAALALALAVAVWEWRRASAAERREREQAARDAKERVADFFRAADEIVAEFRQYVVEGRMELDARGPAYGDLPTVLVQGARGASEALRLLAHTGAVRPAAVIPVVNMARAMAGVETKEFGSSAPSFWEAHIKAQEDSLAEAIKKLDEQRP